MITRLYNWYHTKRYGIPTRSACLSIIYSGYSTNRTLVTYACLYSAGSTIEDIAKDHWVTRERVRQCLLKFVRDGYDSKKGSLI